MFNIHSNCFKPTPLIETLNDFNIIIECDDLAFHQETNHTWAIRSTISKSDSNIKAPTWGSCN